MYLPRPALKRTSYTGIKLEAQSVHQAQSVRTGIKLEAQSSYRDQDFARKSVSASIFKLSPVQDSFLQQNVCTGSIFHLSPIPASFESIFGLPHILALFSQQNMCTGFNLQAATYTGFVLATKHVYRLQSSGCHMYRLGFRKEKCVPASIFKLSPVPASLLQGKVCTSFNSQAATCTGFVLATCVPALTFKLPPAPALFAQGKVCTGFNFKAATCTGFVLATKHVYWLPSSSCHLYRLRSRNKTCVPASIFKLPNVKALFSQQNVCTGFNLQAATRNDFVRARKSVYCLQSYSCHMYRLRSRNTSCVPASIFKLPHVPASVSQQNICTGFNLPAATCTGFVLATKPVYRLQSSSCHLYRLRSCNITCVPASIFKLPTVPDSFSQQNVCTGFNHQAATCTGFVLATKHVYRLQSLSCHLYWLRSRNKTCFPASIIKLPPVPALLSQEKVCTGFNLQAANRTGFVLATKHVYRLQSSSCHLYRLCSCNKTCVPASTFKLPPIPVSFSQQNVCTGSNLPAAIRTGFVIARKRVYRLQSSSCYPYRLRSRNKTCIPAPILKLPLVPASFSQQNMCTGFNLQVVTCIGFVFARTSVYRLQSSSWLPYRLRSHNKTCVPASICKLPPVPVSLSQGKACTAFNLQAATRTGFVLATEHVYRLQSSSCHLYRLRLCKEKCVLASIFHLTHVPASFSQQNVCTGFSLPAATRLDFVLATKHVYRLQAARCHPYRFRYRKEKRGPASIFKLLPVPASFSQQNMCTGFKLQDATRTGFVIARKSVDRLQSSSCYPYRLRSRNKTCVPASIFKLPPVAASFVQGKVCIGFNLSVDTCTGFVVATKRVYRLQSSSSHLH